MKRRGFLYTLLLPFLPTPQLPMEQPYPKVFKLKGCVITLWGPPRYIGKLDRLIEDNSLKNVREIEDREFIVEDLT